MDIQGYLSEIRALYASGQSTEHSFRPALARLFGAIDPAITVINEPKHISDVGAPDFVFNRGAVAIGWCEAKDIGKDIQKFAANDYSKGQKERYKKGLPNLIYTNGLDFEFIRDGQPTGFVSIADLLPGLPERRENFETLANRLRDFAAVIPQSITSSKRLAEMMAGKAAIIKDIMGQALAVDLKAQQGGAAPTDLIGQYHAFKSNLIQDIRPEEFADVYAETIAYGLFAARLHDETPDSFTRAEALELLPKSNPFLRELFVYITGHNLDERLRGTVDELCSVFRATDMDKVLKNFGTVTARQDPFLHFYEDFLAEYNPAKRKARGVWYTPEPVVNFIVRAVDEVLKTEFGLPDGLADTSRIQIDWDTGQNDNKGKPVTLKKSVHRVQILDPATGTGTFLAEAVKLVAQRVKGIAPGQWSNYVEQDLIPRLHGFELLMASYAMCHMKLDMVLTGLGYKPSSAPPRLGVYLTNTLEEGERVEQTLFGLSRAIAEEAKAASNIKRQMPIMCVIGNPPYSGISQNNGEWITSKIEDYKYVDGVHFGERKHWLQDDYVKFIRFAEHMIEKNGEGVLGFITNHGYLDNPTFRGMRWHLMQTFDRIHVIDLHGNSTKKEVSPNGSPDKNVFDIKQGVCIIIAVKRRHGSKNKKSMAEVLHSDLWGSREEKNGALWSKSLTGNLGDALLIGEPQYPFVPRDYSLGSKYSSGFSLAELMPTNVTGIVTARDSLVIALSGDELIKRIDLFSNLSISDVETRNNFFGAKSSGRYPPGDSRGWKLPEARKALASSNWRDEIEPVAYRPFDIRWILYRPDMVDWGRERLMGNLKKANLGLVVGRQGQVVGSEPWNIVTCVTHISDFNIFYRGGGMSFPLYLYPEPGTLDGDIRINFEPKLYARIAKAAGLSAQLRTPDGSDGFRSASGAARPDEVKLFDYIYAVLHCPAYRETYAEFLKTDFPRVPFPASRKTFNTLSAQGEALRRLHLMEDTAIGATPYSFEGEGDSVVDKPQYKGGKVWINSTQYFAKVPEHAWTLHIGGYQPAQKWLKDRKGRTLGWDEIRHYQKIIKILSETHHLMQQITL